MLLFFAHVEANLNSQRHNNVHLTTIVSFLRTAHSMPTLTYTNARLHCSCSVTQNKQKSLLTWCMINGNPRVYFSKS